MQITPCSDKGRDAHLLISVPPERVAEVEAAQNFLEVQRRQRGSQVAIDLSVRPAKRYGWRSTTLGEKSTSE